jgi:NAD(P)-dependent dehydrogenase (short-subunit alcohol dehydrogenase family)
LRQQWSARLPDLTDRAAIVTGAGSGIGRATAERFAREGARVLCVDRDEETVAATVAAITGLDRQHLILFLASDEASFITGSVILADGGMTAQ